jgi:hypothetical protein
VVDAPVADDGPEGRVSFEYLIDPAHGPQQWQQR